MPLLIFLVRRLIPALRAIGTLIANPRARQVLPWSYIRGLPLRDPWLGFSMFTLLLGCLTLIVALASPSARAGQIVAGAGMGIAVLGTLSHWLRYRLMIRRIRS
jgi:hypothetical protein